MSALLGLAAYGSDSDSASGGEDENPAPMPPPTAIPKSGGGGLLGKLPPPSSGGAGGGGLFGKLPAPSGSKKKVPWKPPIKALNPPPLEEDEPKKKKLKFGSSAGASLKDLLPKPKNDLGAGGGLGGGSGGTKLDLGGGGQGGDAPAVKAPKAPEEPAAPPQETDAFSMYKVDHAADEQGPVQGPAATGYADYYGAQYGGQYGAEGLQQQQQPAMDPMYANYYYGHADSTGTVNMGPAPTGDQMLQAAMAQERAQEKKRKKGKDDPFAALANIEVKTVNQADLTAKAFHGGTDLNPTGAAFSREDREKLVKAAGAKPSQQHRQKHQLTQLYHDAKLREVELMENRVKALKTKGETQAKYGW